MKIKTNYIIQTSTSILIGTNRILLGIIIMLVGSLKLMVSSIQQVWCTQLTEIQVPFCSLFYWFIPLLEIGAGLALLFGYLSRVAAFSIVPIMMVAIYVYLTVINPEAFLAHPYEAGLPPILAMMALLILIYGGGSWSMDLKKVNKNRESNNWWIT